MYYINAIGLGILVPLLAYTIFSTLNSYVSYKARNLSALLRDTVSVRLRAILGEPDAPNEARNFASHLLDVMADSDQMQQRGLLVVDYQNDTEDEDDNVAVDDFKQRVGSHYVDRFERIFPMMTTACLLLHPKLGRMYYRTIVRTAAASSAAQRAMQQAEDMKSQRTDQADVVVPPTPLLFQSSRQREERLWECLAA